MKQVDQVGTLGVVELQRIGHAVDDALTIPSLLLSTGETILGIGLVRAGFRPRLTGWVLAPRRLWS